MKGSLVIVGFFVLGIAVGLSHVFQVDPESMSSISFIALCLLMFCVGVSIGRDSKIVESVKKLNPRLMLLPLCTVAGTLAGSAVAAAFLPYSATHCMAVGSGFAYYSLSSIFITQYIGPELGTVALLANIAREILTLLLAPLLVKWFGRLAPISVGGATTMDTTLPIITRCSGNDLVMLSIFHGFIVDFSVPFLVTFFCLI